MALPANRKFRLLSLFGEHLTLVMLSVPSMLLLSPSQEHWGFYGIVVLYLNKDFLNGRSPLRRLVGTQVQQAGGPANELQCVVRNMTFPVWPLEVLVVAITGHKRFGDYLVHTQVVEILKKESSWKQDLTAYRVNAYTLCAVLATVLYLFLLDTLFHWLGF